MAITNLNVTIGSDSGVGGDEITNVAGQSLHFTFSSNTNVTNNARLWYSTDNGTNWTQIDAGGPAGKFTVTDAGAGQTLNIPSFTLSGASGATYLFRMNTSSGSATGGSPSNSATVVYDPVAPVVTSAALTDNNDGFHVQGTITGNATTATVRVYELDGNGDKIPGSEIVVSDVPVSGGSFSVDVPATHSAGHTYGVSVVGTDVAGNNSAVYEGSTIEAATCFMAGTMIATPEGERAVESLTIGDLVLTTEGKAVPVRWMGRQTVSMTFADKLRSQPIRVMAGALDENVPSRDLLVSPDHALLVDGVLVHAGALVNGSTIVRDANVPNVFTYFHVELEDHSLILAENTPAETFIDNVDRMAFNNWPEHELLYAGTAPLVEMDLPRAKAHRQVAQATRRRLAERAVALLPMAKIA